MKIRFLLLNAFTVGGTVRTVINQANSLAAAGHDVELVSVHRERRTPAFPVDPRVRLRPLVDGSADAPAWRRALERRMQRSPSRLVPPSEVRHDRFNRLTDRRLTRYLRSLDGGVLVTTRPALNLLAARLAPTGVVRVAQEHLHYARHQPELTREIDHWYRRLDAVAVLTGSDEEAYRRVLAGSGVRVERIPNALNDGDRTPSSLDGKLVVAAGRLVKAKGFDLLIKAFERIVHDHPDWKLRIYGSGAERKKLRRLIHRKHLYNHVLLMGRTTRLDEELSKASVFALSSRHEGFGMVLAEAMSHGVPVVSFDCPQGPREIVTDGEDGLLVPNGDVPALTGALRRLIEDEPLRRDLGGRAAESAHRYDRNSIRPRWERLFTELLDAKDPRGGAADGPRAA
ncbi:glycosyltransferase family 4 protein [Streptomyces sp. NPDC002055]|uniref:glycosyltransferase family 4 protein n=1 Tax=Streptomyces sp. NPDC002055 TaxID=3154534 RepID=UPI003323E006